MKKIFISFFVLLSALTLTAQQNIKLHIEPMLGVNSFALDQPYNAVGFNYPFKFTRLDYYISNIKITHDGGQVKPLIDWYILARPAQVSEYNLGTHNDIQNIEAISFSIGVDSVRNHADPSAIGTPQVLTPQFPSMHWGWAAGYFFMAMEGIAGPNLNKIVEIHALGDNNYKNLSFPINAEQVDADTKMIHLTADYSHILKGINVGQGLILHGSNEQAVTAMNNMANEVFSVAAVGVLAPEFDGKFALAPNPAVGNIAYANFNLPIVADYEVTVTDLLGRQVFRQALGAQEGTVRLENMTDAGIYFVHLWQNGKPVAYEKLSVTK